jgi:hypothetical protein
VPLELTALLVPLERLALLVLLELTALLVPLERLEQLESQVQQVLLA